jgi:1-acyl-sn-glycerol-3-phosphate acyltransferase
MQPVVIDKPYRFVPPYHSWFGARLLQRLLPRTLAREYGLVSIDYQGLDHLRNSLAAGNGVLLAPNHCRPCDPGVISELCRNVGTAPYAMASWHLFMYSPWRTFLIRLAGAFSIYREGMDRQALAMAIDILQQSRRPLLIFPEGAISRHNDRLNSMMDGVSFIARSAAKKRAESGKPGGVVVHAVGIRYKFHGDVTRSIGPVLDEIEHRLTWRLQSHLSPGERIARVGAGLLCLKEIEYMGQPQPGTLPERLHRLIDQLLVPLEQEWLKGRREDTTVGRVKKLRIAILPEMVQGAISDAERDRRWKQLADMYLAQQLSCYPPDYLGENPSPERLIETVERFEEDLTDVCRPHPPMTAMVQVGPAIAVAPVRERGAAEDPLMAELERQLHEMLGLS